AELEYGSFNLVQGRALLNVPIVEDVLAAKFAASYRNRDGYVKNLIPGGRDFADEDVATFRGALLFTPNSDFELYLTADYLRDRSGSHPGRNVSDGTTLSCTVFNVCAPHANRVNVTSATY